MVPRTVHGMAYTSSNAEYWMVYLNTHTLLTWNHGRTGLTGHLPEKNSFQLYLDWHYSLRCRCSLSPWLIDQDQRRQTLMNKTCFLCSLSLSSLPPFNSFTSEYSLHVITHVLAVELNKWTSTLGGYYQWCDVLCGHSSSSFPGILNLMFCFLLSSI